MRASSPTCVICMRPAKEISSYIHLAKEEGLSHPDDAVKYLDNTYNFNDNVFCCPDCLFKINYPKGKAMYDWQNYNKTITKTAELALA